MDNVTHLHNAIKSNNKKLIVSGLDPTTANEVDGDGQNALHVAAQYGCSLPLFKRILGMINDVNASDKSGQTALHWAVRENHEPIVELLLTTPLVNTNVVDNFGSTPWDYAASNRETYGGIIELFAKYAPSITRTILNKIYKKPSKFAFKEEIPGYIKVAIQPKPTIHPKYGNLRY